VSALIRSAPDTDRGPSLRPDGHLRWREQDGPLEGLEAFQPVLTIRARVDEAETSAFVRQTLQEIRAHIMERNFEVVGPPFSLCHPLSEHTVDVEAGWPVTRGHGSERIHAGAIPATLLGRHGTRINGGPEISLLGPPGGGQRPRDWHGPRPKPSEARRCGQPCLREHGNGDFCLA
jgi:hypothetical protein